MRDYWNPATTSVMQESIPSAWFYLKLLTYKEENLKTRISKLRGNRHGLNQGLCSFLFNVLLKVTPDNHLDSSLILQFVWVVFVWSIKKHKSKRKIEIRHASLIKSYVSYENRVTRRLQNIYIGDNGALWRVLSTFKKSENKETLG